MAAQLARSPTPLHVMIIGGGLGGLCLAHGLKQAGVSVAVYERDRSRVSRTEGFRIHINPAGNRALYECLPQILWRAFLAIAGKTGGGFTFLTERLRPLVTVDEDLMTGGGSGPVERQYPIDRTALRQLLLAGLDDVVHFDKPFERYERLPDGRVMACFADGFTVGDVLVGADGASSRVRRQYLPQAHRVESGAVAVAFKVPLTDRTRAWLPPRLLTGMNFVKDRSLPCFLFTAVFDRTEDPIAALRGLKREIWSIGVRPGLMVDPMQGYQSYILCAFVGRRDAFPPGINELECWDLEGIVEHMMSDWHPDLRRLIADCDPASLARLPLMTAVPLGPWEATNITLLGDAIHSMPPTGGFGGNMALHDAKRLSRALGAVHRGECGLQPAIRDYEAKMRAYGFAAVRAALRMQRLGTLSNPMAVDAMRIWFRTCNAIPPLKWITFRNTWARHARPCDAP